MLFSVIAHAGEDHSDIVESAQHSFEINPFVASFIGLAFIAAATYVIFKITKSSTAATFVLLALLLIFGLFTYSSLPLLSGVCIVSGFVISILISLGGFTKNSE